MVTKARLETQDPGQKYLRSILGKGVQCSHSRGCTGKSQLLQQLRAFRKGAGPSHLSTSDHPGGQKAQAPKNRAESQTGRKKHIKLWTKKQNALDLGDPLGTQPARKVLLPAMGQLYSTQTQKHT